METTNSNNLLRAEVELVLMQVSGSVRLRLCRKLENTFRGLADWVSH
jgi:hypothetical protein